MTESEKTEAETLNNGIYYSINSKKRERNDLKEQAMAKLSSISSGSSSNLIDLSNIDIESAKLLFSYEQGNIYEFTTVDGQKYEAYIPNQVDPKAPLIVYDSGGNSSDTYNSSTDWSELKIYFEQDHVMLRSLRRDSSYYYMDLCNKLNLEPESRLFISHSGGTTYNFNEFIDLVEEDNSVPGVVAVMDGYTPGYWFRNTGVTQKLIENKTIVFGFHVNTRNSYAIEYEKLAADGVNMLLLSDQSDLGRSHNGVNMTLIDNNVLEYLTGDGELPDNYVIKYYNTNEENADASGFVTVDHSQVKTLDDVYNFFGIER